MLIPHINFDEIFREKFPYPATRYQHSPMEYERLSILGRRWHILHIVLGILLFFAIAAGLMFVFQWINASLYTHLDPSVKWYPQTIPPFSIPALIVSLPIGVLLAISTIRLFHYADHKEILDMVNVRLRYDSVAAFLWFLKLLAVGCLIAFVIVGWCYVSVSEKGIDIKNARAISVKHYSYDDISTITHYDSAIYKGEVIPYDHFKLQFNNGQQLRAIAPEIDLNACIAEIAKHAKVPVTKEKVDR